MAALNGTTRRTRAQIAQLESRIAAILEADHPQSVRHVFYRLVDDRTLDVPVPKTDQGYKQVCKRLVAMRAAGTVPYGWVSDSTRMGYHVTTFNDPGELLSYAAGLYRVNEWSNAPRHIEVWTESRSIAGVVQGTCRQLGVSLYPAAGFSSDTFIWEAAQYVRRIGKPATLLYVGDSDPAGYLIDQDILDKMRRHLDGIEVELRRIAVTEAQIAEYQLPTKPRKAGERRRPDIQETVEAEALPARILRRLVTDAVDEYLDPEVRRRTRLSEQAQRDTLHHLARNFPLRVPAPLTDQGPPIG